MSDAAESRRFKGHFAGRNVHAHAADDERLKFLIAKAKGEVFEFHVFREVSINAREADT